MREEFDLECGGAIGVWALLLAVVVDFEFEGLEDEGAVVGVRAGVWYSVGLVCAFGSRVSFRLIAIGVIYRSEYRRDALRIGGSGI